ncbi:RagB/SusD family nutrient uptake outer membrane protein [Belliella kenyensis]|uniref:RagB/SusD family nutrient uptake outer membrane protein n=1 Tax=Belliella kenyensis TaxID=1472724 RepID=A0ABV8EIC8_9BACT|nr:RagB/SusD family nutrient uptake outer membrane protein [Belliella kenyensis]MCH7401160.1 RagB/SusD family nutrient uptake outer membrane protein [Belliella kenyensis]MDN3604157.1 RagB/SusD family nutrient uptake outer membrane protein [Belliella kenyensis]
MKIIKYLSLALLILSSACSEDFTNVIPQGSITSGNYWQSEEDAINAANGLYQHWDNDHLFGRGIMYFIAACDDFHQGRTDAAASAIRNFQATGQEGRIAQIYPLLYTVIQRANTVLRYVPNMNINQDVKNRVLGEAYFARAHAYLWLSPRYGDHRAGIPIVTVENMDDLKFTRPAHVIENYRLIEQDLLQAAELLPYFTTYNSSDLGRAHKDAAYAYLAKNALYWAGHDNGKWADAVRYADMVINSPTDRRLINTGNPEVDFESVFYVNNNFSSEYVFSTVSSKERGQILPGVMLENTGWGLYNGWGTFSPTLELYNAFESGDARKKATLLAFGDEFTFLGNPRRYYSGNSWTGIQFNKYMHPYRFPQEVHLNPNGDYPTTDLNVPLIRFAEILLIKAEALIMQGQNGDEPINLVRSRAGLAPKTGATLSDLKQERRVELAGEYADRHLDLVRWGDAQAAYARPATGRNHANKTNPDSSFEVYQTWPARTFNPAIHHVWPIPPNTISVSGIAQNEGW